MATLIRHNGTVRNVDLRKANPRKALYRYGLAACPALGVDKVKAVVETLTPGPFRTKVEWWTGQNGE